MEQNLQFKITLLMQKEKDTVKEKREFIIEATHPAYASRQLIHSLKKSDEYKDYYSMSVDKEELLSNQPVNYSELDFDALVDFRISEDIPLPDDIDTIFINDDDCEALMLSIDGKTFECEPESVILIDDSPDKISFTYKNIKDAHWSIVEKLAILDKEIYFTEVPAPISVLINNKRYKAEFMDIAIISPNLPYFMKFIHKPYELNKEQFKEQNIDLGIN